MKFLEIKLIARLIFQITSLIPVAVTDVQLYSLLNRNINACASRGSNWRAAMLKTMFVRIKCTNRGEECLRKKKKKERKVKRETRIICRRFAATLVKNVRITREISCGGYIIQIGKRVNFEIQVDTTLYMRTITCQR